MTKNAISALASRYAVNDVDDLRVTRFRQVGETESVLWRVECPCGWTAGPFIEAESANARREWHDGRCLWPRA